MVNTGTVMKPILFNTQMVRAILDGRKTQTRRPIKDPILYSNRNPVFIAHNYETDAFRFTWSGRDDFEIMPLYRPGDILWVRETWNVNNLREDGDEYEVGFIYRAAEKPDYGFRWVKTHHESYEKYMDGMSLYFDKWRPSIHMPKEAARLFLRVTDVRVERLQDMTEDDAFAEGYASCPAEHTRYFPEGGAEPCFNLGDCPAQYWYCQHSIPEGFGRDIWDKTIKPADRDCFGWAANPFVFVYSFDNENGVH